jgi:hypothetical protein
VKFPPKLCVSRQGAWRAGCKSPPLKIDSGAGGTGMRISDFEGDVLDQSNLPFIRGGNIQGNGVGYQPIAVFGSVPRSVKSRWGAEWKKAAIEYSDRTGLVGNGPRLIRKPRRGRHKILMFLDHIDPRLDFSGFRIFI